MKTFEQFKEETKKFDPKAFTGGIVNNLLNRMDTKSINIPSGEEITSKVSDMTSKLQTKLEDPNTSKKLKDPSTQQKFDNFSRMLKSLSTEK